MCWATSRDFSINVQSDDACCEPDCYLSVITRRVHHQFTARSRSDHSNCVGERITSVRACLCFRESTVVDSRSQFLRRLVGDFEVSDPQERKPSLNSWSKRQHKLIIHLHCMTIRRARCERTRRGQQSPNIRHIARKLIDNSSIFTGSGIQTHVE